MPKVYGERQKPGPESETGKTQKFLTELGVLSKLSGALKGAGFAHLFLYPAHLHT